MEISVIIPTYKPKEYIWECLDSLSGQTLGAEKFEIIIILNGCCEPWKSQIESWMSLHCNLNITFIQTNTPGVSNARNIALEQAKGNYICFIDDDDYVSSQYLEEMLKRASSDTVVLSNTLSFIDGSEEYNESYGLHRVYENLSHKKDINLFNARSLFNGPCMKLIPKSFTEGCIFDTRLKNGEDSLYMFRISRNISKIELASTNAVYFRRVRQDSATLKHRPLKQKLSTSYLLIQGYIKAFFRRPQEYDFKFFVSRILATFKGHLFIN